MAQRDWRQWGSSKPATAGQRGVSVLNRWQHENCVSFESLLTKAFQQSGDALLQNGEPILVHCNSHVDGYWTDLTRTYVLGAPDERLRPLFSALTSAREAALAIICPGICAAAVDRAARTVLADKGYGAAFRHATGHGVGFSPIDHEEWPRIHPCSRQILEEGMVFNIEPGIYLPGYGGLRDCNMVAVTASGYELLSPFQRNPEDWCLAA